MRSRYFLVAPLAAAIALALVMVDARRRARAQRRAGHDDPRRSGGAGRHGLQLGHRARARRAPAGAADRRFRSEVHGHRRDGQPGDGAFPLADRAVTRERARAELRIRSPRARKAAAQVHRPGGDARAHGAAGRHDAPGRGQGRAPQLQQRAGVADRQGDRHRPPCRPHPFPRAARTISTAARRSSGHSRTAARRRIASRRRTLPASWRGTPTTC